MANVRLSWPANPASELVSAYEVWEAVGQGSFILKASVPDPELLINDIPAGKYRWMVRAVNLAGNGPMSDEAVSPDLPSKPGTPVVEVL